MSFIDNLKIGIKMALILLVPLVVLIVLAVQTADGKRQILNGAEEANGLVKLSAVLDQVAHNFAVERGLTAGFLASGGQRGGDKVKAQRKKADAAADNFKQYISDHDTSAYQSAVLSRIQSLADSISQRQPLRTAVDELDKNSGAFTYYSTINTLALEIIERLVADMKDAELSRPMNAYVAMLWMKELAGKERGALNGVFTSGDVSASKYSAISGYISEQGSKAKAFDGYASAEQSTLYQTELSPKSVAAVMDMRAVFTSRGEKIATLSQLQSLLGYGGLVHQFKNYILRGDSRYRLAFEADFGRANALINDYRNIEGLTDGEGRSLSTVKATIKNYQQAMLVVRNKLAAGTSIQAIDQSIKISDSAAIAALRELAKVSGVNSADWFAASTARIGKIKKVGDQVSSDIEGIADTSIAEASSQLTMIVSVLSGLVLFTLLFGSYVAITIVRNVKAIASTMADVENTGDLSRRVNVNNTDEVGQMAAAFNRLMEVQQSAIKDVNGVMSAVANGDFTQRVTAELKGDLAKLKQELNISLDSLDTAIKEISKVMQAVQAGDFTARIDTKLKGDLGALRENINHSQDRLESAINNIAEVTAAQQNGDMSKRVTGSYEGQLDLLQRAINGSAESVGVAVNEISAVMSAMRQGDFTKRVEADLKGELSELKENINLSFDNLAGAMADIVNVASALEEGDLTQRVTGNYAGQLNVLKNAFNQSTDSISSAFTEVGAIMIAVREGNFSKRINTELKGELSQLQDNVNQSLSSLESAMKDIVDVASALKEGDLSQRVTGSYAGQLNVLKNAFNDSTDSISSAFTEVSQIMLAVREGDFTKRIDTELKGELSQLQDNVNQSLSRLESAMVDIVDVAKAQEKGDLRERVSGDYAGQLGVLKDAINASAENLESAFSNVHDMAVTVTHGADEISQGNLDLSQRTEEQASSLEEIASSMEEMTSTVGDSSKNAITASQHVVSVKDKAVSSGAIVDKTISSMNEIKSSSKKIGDIISVIDEIAFQTNLLALNAAVEAARAGEQGRGFAVVAGEVRNLAQRSASAAKDIKNLIEDSTGKVDEGCDLVESSGGALKEIEVAVVEASTMTQDISSAAAEQLEGIGQVSEAITQMDGMTQQNAALVEEISAAGEALSEQANQMMKLLGFFKVGAKSKGASPTLAIASDKSTSALPSPSKAGAADAGSVDNGSDWEEF